MSVVEKTRGKDREGPESKDSKDVAFYVGSSMEFVNVCPCVLALDTQHRCHNRTVK